jgi:maltooligosyltrehalose trehalohydrolase
VSVLGWRLPIGAEPVAEGVRFRVWAPGWRRVDAVIYGPDAESVHALEPEDGGYFSGTVPGVSAGARYRYRLGDGESYPDPASRSQPDGVHGHSEVVDPEAYAWGDRDWAGLDPDRLVVYELHVGAFTPEGTFAAAAGRLPLLAELGVTAVEVMPIAGFPGTRNWGYDGVNLFAPAAPYGGPEGFRRLVDAAHAAGLGVVLDVVYNHLGPEGNHLPVITSGSFFTDRHTTPWGDAVNFDGPDSAGVREMVVQNALYWCHEYHVDGLRLDATHAIADDSPVHILEELAIAVHALRPARLLIAEDERNELRIVLPRAQGGYGLDAVWADDLHHQLRRLTAGDTEGYFAEYAGTVEAVVETLRRGWWRGVRAARPVREPESTREAAPEREPEVESGSADRVDAARGPETVDPESWSVPPRRFVHCIQNHDQVGNRPFGERLNHQIEAVSYRALSALLLVSPYTPLLWMGQEWAASSPFLYFTDHPPELGRLVTEGRRDEFSGFSDFQDPARRSEIPDPQARETFERSRLLWDEREDDGHAGVLALYRELLALRGSDPALLARGREDFAVEPLGEGALAVRRGSPGGAGLILIVNLRGEVRVELDTRPATRPQEGTLWSFLLATEEARFGGSGTWGRLEPDGTIHLQSPGAVLLRGIAD